MLRVGEGVSEFMVMQKDKGARSAVDRGVGTRKEEGEEGLGSGMSGAGGKTKSGRRRHASKEHEGLGRGAEQSHANGHSGHANHCQLAYGTPPPLEKDMRRSVFVDGTNGAYRALLHPRASIFSTSLIVPAEEEEEERKPGLYPLIAHLTDGVLLVVLIGYITFWEWCVVMAVLKEVKRTVGKHRKAQEVVLKHFMGVIGYKWWAKGREPLTLTPQGPSLALAVRFNTLTTCRTPQHTCAVSPCPRTTTA